jgi:hypothetical protein
MRTPKTVKGYLKMLIEIAKDSAYDLKNVIPDEVEFIAIIRGGIQNELGEDLLGVMKKHNLKFKG